MKHIFTHLAFLCLFGTSFAQQDPQFTQYMHNKLFMNPAYAGMKHALCFSAIAREQWAGFEGAPRSGVLSGDVYLEKLSGGIGMNLMYDQLGFERNMAIQLAYSFHREIVRDNFLGIGIQIGTATKILGPTGGQSWVASTNWQSDPTVPPSMKKTNLDAGLGVWFQSEKLWFGLSASHVTEGQFNAGTINVNGPPMTVHNLLYSISRHYWITGGYNYHLPGWTLKPSMLVKTDAVVTTVDVSCIASMNNGFWFGATWRYNDAVCPMIGFEWIRVSKNHAITEQYAPGLDPDFHDKTKPSNNRYAVIKLGFAYDYTTSRLANYNNGTFELFLNYCIPYVPRDARHGDVRNFR